MDDRSTADWRTSTRSSGANCVEVALLGEGVALRNSRDRKGPELSFTNSEWVAFIGGVRRGEFELPLSTKGS